MKVEHYEKTPAQTYGDMEGVGVRWVINKDDGAPTFAMRVIEVQPGHNTAFHTHDWEHGVFILNGQGVVRKEDGSETPVEPETVVFIPPGKEHGFYNRGDDVLRFICVIPLPED